MLNNPALDISIGLIFIYALYSLFTTTLTELISTLINLRAKNLKRGIKRMLDDDDKKVFSEIMLARPEIIFLGRKGLIFGREKFPSSIKPSTFAKAFVNGLKELYGMEESLQELTNKLKPDDKDNDSSLTKKFIYNLLVESNNNLDRLNTLLENWFDEMMNRVSGWYKKWILLITFFVGFAIALSLNVNTIEIAQKLGKDKKARLALVEVSTEYVKTLQATDSLEKKNSKTINELNGEIKLILEQSQEVESLIDLKYPWAEGNNKKGKYWIYFLGCFITSIALSLGAPFWFDLLNKLVKLKGAGVQEQTENKKLDQPVG